MVAEGPRVEVLSGTRCGPQGTVREQRIWALTTYFNPGRYRTRLRNYRFFRQQLCISLMAVEWSPDGVFQLGDDEADLVVRVRGGDLMWQKERLLGIGMRYLPDSCQYVLLIDADILLLNSSWPERLCELLECYPVVQPFREVRHLPPLPVERSAQEVHALLQVPDFYLARQSFADRCMRGTHAAARPTVNLYPESDRRVEVKRLESRPSFGHAWAVRRAFIERIGLYEYCIAGSGDMAFAMAISGRFKEFCAAYPLSESQHSHYLRWATCASDAAGPERLGCLEGVALHLFHGHLQQRHYRARLEVLSASGFDPSVDLLAQEGLPFSWMNVSGCERQLRDFFASYFRRRAEDEAPSALE